ncbi:MAG: hypothetical protein IJN25_04980 [Clostridia bacterium]|nr:hypothetical protein [Clostridia bacterium]
MTEKQEKTKKPAPYKTYALAEEAWRDKDTNTARPSEENVEGMREWSKENKL